MSYTMIIAEKPSAAKRIASALAEGGIKKIGKHGVASFRISRGGRDIVVAPAVGHLFILTQRKAGAVWTYPVFDVEWKPTFQNIKSALWSRKYFENIKSLAKDADEFISSCDYDLEGAVIAYNILRFICGTEKARRMKFSTLTTPDLVQAYEQASPELDFPQIEAGLTRHFLDYFWGINLSRALTLALKEAGWYKTLSTGRVQGPTLQILEKRQKEIESFKPKPFWEIQLTGLAGPHGITALHVKGKFWDKGQAETILKNCEGRKAAVSDVERKQQKQYPPFPFDLTTLQRESYRCFGYSPKMTLDIAQSLYEQALISYPRTASQKLSAKIGYKSILKNLAKQKVYQELCGKLLSGPRLRPNEGKKTDPAHPAIFPTGNLPKALNSYQKKLYDMIVKRFLAVFADPAIRESMKVVIAVNGEKFIAQGIRTIKPNWMDFYRPYARFKEQILPDVREGQDVRVEKIEILDKETQPPKRFTQATILKEMENLGLGTKGTRALILQTLYERGYIDERTIIVTRLGQAVVTALSKNCPEIVSAELTRKFEEEMQAIQEGKKKRQDVVKEAEDTLRKILARFREHETETGKELLVVVREQQKIESTIGECKCGGNLIIRYSRKGKRFTGCNKYPKCTETFSLPHTGSLKVISQKCPKCGMNIISVKAKGKRPWKLCVRCGFVGGKKKAKKS